MAEADIIIQKLGKQEDQAAEDRAISILVVVDLVTALVFHHHKVILVVVVLSILHRLYSMDQMNFLLVVISLLRVKK